jgi:hypothetical protein
MAAEKPTREELISRYIEANAIENVLLFLVGNRNVPNAEDSPFALSSYASTWDGRSPWADLVDDEEPEVAEASRAFESLWPTAMPDGDEDAESMEYATARLRSDLLAAQLLAALAANADYLSRSAAWLLDGVAHDLSKEKEEA